jgi:hypothetical protein
MKTYTFEVGDMSNDALVISFDVEADNRDHAAAIAVQEIGKLEDTRGHVSIDLGSPLLINPIVSFVGANIEPRNIIDVKG